MITKLNIFKNNEGEVMDYENILKIVSRNIDCGIFILDTDGKVVFYNESANNQAGVSIDCALGYHILDLFPKLNKDTSTLLKVLDDEKPIINKVQKYYNYKFNEVTIMSTTLPIYEDDVLVGVIEISKDTQKYREFNNIIKIKGNEYIKEKAYYSLDDIVGKNQKIIKMKINMKKISNSPSPVLIYGETGTGKELVVQSIHNESYRKDRPFIAQNCAAIPATLLESILFGTTLGSFTGAKNSPGLFEHADGGTLFLDEINSMDINLQAKLLRIIQDGIVRRIGDKSVKKVDVRLIAALNIEPYEALKKGQIRQDLFFRLNVLNIYIPPLRERMDDLDELIEHFISLYNRRLDKKIEGISQNIKELFENHNWPGNIRELQHIIEHSINMAEANIITYDDLPDYFKGYEVKKNIKEEVEEIKVDRPLKELLREFEYEVIVNSLKSNSFNISKTANILGIPRQTLHYKLNKLNIIIDKVLND